MKDPNAIFNAFLVLLLYSIDAPINAPINVPIMNPIGGINNPIKNPIVLPMSDSFLPPNSFTLQNCIKFSMIEKKITTFGYIINGLGLF